MMPYSTSSLYELNINNLIHYAYKRYIENIQTIELMQQATTRQQKEEIALIALLDVKDDLNISLSFQSPYLNINNLQQLRVVILRAINSSEK